MSAKTERLQHAIQVGAPLAAHNKHLWSLVTSSFKGQSKPVRQLLEVNTPGDPIRGLISWKGTQVLLSLSTLEQLAAQAAQKALQGSGSYHTAASGHGGVAAKRAKAGLAGLDATALQQELQREARQAQHQSETLALGLVAWCGLGNPLRQACHAGPSQGEQGSAASHQFDPLALITAEGLLKALTAYTLVCVEEGPMDLPHCMMASQLGIGGCQC